MLLVLEGRAQDIETKSLMGPLLRLGVFEREWVSDYAVSVRVEPWKVLMVKFVSSPRLRDRTS